MDVREVPIGVVLRLVLSMDKDAELDWAVETFGQLGSPAFREAVCLSYARIHGVDGVGAVERALRDGRIEVAMYMRCLFDDCDYFQLLLGVAEEIGGAGILESVWARALADAGDDWPSGCARGGQTAAARGDAEAVRWFAERGILADGCANLAAANGHASVLELLRGGVDLGAAVAAAERGRTDVLEWILSSCPVDAACDEVALAAAEHGRVGVLEWIRARRLARRVARGWLPWPGPREGDVWTRVVAKAIEADRPEVLEYASGLGDAELGGAFRGALGLALRQVCIGRGAVRWLARSGCSGPAGQAEADLLDAMDASEDRELRAHACRWLLQASEEPLVFLVPQDGSGSVAARARDGRPLFDEHLLWAADDDRPDEHLL